MGKRKGAKNLTEQVQSAIVRGYQAGLSQTKLALMFGISQPTVFQVLKRYQREGKVVVKKSPGKKRITSRLTDRTILRVAREFPRADATQIQQELALSDGILPSTRTIRRRLQQAGLHGRVACRKPLINKKNRDIRLEFAHKHKDWTLDQWRRVVWSDESKFNLMGSDGRVYVRRPVGKRHDPKYLLPTIKHGGGNVMVHGVFSGLGLGPLQRITGIMDRFVYRKLLLVARRWIKQTHKDDYVWQQDNDPKHTSKFIKDFFVRNGWKIIEKWPSQSPDLNPIEHLWEELDRHTRHIRVKNADEKFEVLQKEWKKISQDVIDKLLESMPSRCQAVITAKGYPTKY